MNVQLCAKLDCLNTERDFNKFSYILPFSIEKGSIYENLLNSVSVSL